VCVCVCSFICVFEYYYYYPNKLMMGVLYMFFKMPIAFSVVPRHGFFSYLLLFSLLFSPIFRLFTTNTLQYYCITFYNIYTKCFFFKCCIWCMSKICFFFNALLISIIQFYFGFLFYIFYFPLFLFSGFYLRSNTEADIFLTNILH